MFTNLTVFLFRSPGRCTPIRPKSGSTYHPDPFGSPDPPFPQKSVRPPNSPRSKGKRSGTDRMSLYEATS